MTYPELIVAAVKADPGVALYVHVVMTAAVTLHAYEDNGRRDLLWSLLIGSLWFVVVPVVLFGRVFTIGSRR